MNLPENWTITTLGKVSEKPQYGWTSKASPTGSIKYLRTTDLSGGKVDWETVPFCLDEPDDVAKYQVKDNDIVVSRAGSVGLSYRIESPPPNSVFASYLIRIRALTVETKYLEFFLKSAEYWRQISEVAAGIAVQNINATKLSELRIPLAPLPEQKRIVAKLDKLFAHLDQLKGRLEKIPVLLKQFRQAILTHAVTGKLTEEWRASYDAKAHFSLLETDVNPNQIESTFDIMGWRWAPVSAVSHVISGYAFKSSEFTSEGYQLIRMGNLYGDRLDLSRSPVFLPTDLDSTLVKKYSIQENDILLTLTGTKYKRDYGYAVLVRSVNETLLLNQRIVALRSVINPIFLLYLLRSDVFRDQFFSFETGGVNQGNVGSRALASIILPVPSIEEQKEIVRRVESLFAMADKIEASYNTLKEKIDQLPQAILAKAFRGELVEQASN